MSPFVKFMISPVGRILRIVAGIALIAWGLMGLSGATGIKMCIRDRRPAVDGDATGRRPIQPAQTVEQRRLAAAGAPHQGDEAAGGDAKVDAAQGVDVAAADGVGALDTLGQDGRRGHRCLLSLIHI